jgi:nicotinamidase-related amidase
MRYEKLPIPECYNPANARAWSYRPDQNALMALAGKWMQEHSIIPSSWQEMNINFLGIDFQRDFCFPQGNLYVGGRSGVGPLDDNDRTARFIYSYLHLISKIILSLDNHFVLQIFFPMFWRNKAGEPLKPNSLIKINRQKRWLRLANYALDGSTVLNDDVGPDPAMAEWLCYGEEDWLYHQAFHYVSELEKMDKNPLHLWSPHCISGEEGQSLVGVIQEACMFHSMTRRVQTENILKGDNPWTEAYSILGPEILTGHDGDQIATRNTELATRLISADMLIVAGQAASHCVPATVDDLVIEIILNYPECLHSELFGRIYILTDCMSPVCIPDGQGGFLADYTPQAEEYLRKFESLGMHLVKSTDPMESWPGVQP